MTDLSLPDGWTERTFDRGEYGGDLGLVARLASDAGEATLSVLPVAYERRGFRDHIDGLSDDFEHHSGTVAVHGPRDVRSRTAHVLDVQFAPNKREREVVYAVTASPDDALAIACYLARAADDAAAMRDRVEDHGGSGVGPTGSTALSDDELADETFGDDPDRCLFTGKRTSSHRLRIPFRYAVATDRFPHTDVGVPRAPTLLAGFDAVVSHDAWTAQSLGSVEPTTRIRRSGPGAYELPDGDAFSEGSADRLVLVRHGEDD